MAIDTFKQWLAAFSDEDDLTAFNLAVVAEGLDIIKDLNDQNVGGETVEERIGTVIDDKRKLADAVVGTSEAFLSELSTDELRDLVVLEMDS